uniref:Uncharacterized protein n=1 Tax=Bionectria ochroleuca TaxID=29856 RepID=A0A0B7JPH8_BIOOC
MEPHNLPPAYEDAGHNNSNTSQENAPAEPPSYALAADSDPREQLFGSELPTRISDGNRGICGVEKVMYRLTDHSGEGSVRARTRHIYDVRPQALGLHVFGHVDVMGKLGPKSTYKHRELVTRRPNWSVCEVKDALQVKEGFRIKLLQKDKPVEWKDKDGRVVALETNPPKPKDSSIEAQPRLDIQSAGLDAKDFDFLVACWIGRLWRIYQIHNEEPFSWDKFKRISAQSPVKGTGIYT